MTKDQSDVRLEELLNNSSVGYTPEEGTRLHVVTRELLSSETLNVLADKGKSYVQLFKSQNYSESAIFELRDSIEAIKSILDKAYTDDLTQLMLKKPFNSSVEREVETLKRKGGEGSLAFIDIDHFKKFNDTYGHLNGDKVLSEVAQTVKDSVRGMDIVGRYGGEEIVVYFPGADPFNAYKASENIRKAVRDKKLDLDGRDANVTLSIGIVGVKDPAYDFDMKAFVKAADKAMYRSKASGRDRVTLHEDSYF